MVRARLIREGIVSLWSMHTTFAVFMNESQTGAARRYQAFLEQMVDRDADWKHNDPDHSDCDRLNADAHLRAMLLGHSLTLQVSGGDVVLGQWQRVLVAELDGPRARTLRVQIMGCIDRAASSAGCNVPKCDVAKCDVASAFRRKNGMTD